MFHFKRMREEATVIKHMQCYILRQKFMWNFLLWFYYRCFYLKSQSLDYCLKNSYCFISYFPMAFPGLRIFYEKWLCLLGILSAAASAVKWWQKGIYAREKLFACNLLSNPDLVPLLDGLVSLAYYIPSFHWLTFFSLTEEIF